MRIISVTNNLIGSKLIRWATSGSSSHIIFLFDNIVLHSSLFGVELAWWKTYQKKCTLIKEIEVNLCLSVEENIWQSIIDLRDNARYDFGAIAYQAWRRLLFALFKIPMPKKNKWQNPNKDQCIELYNTIRMAIPVQLPVVNNIDMLSPDDFMKELEKLLTHNMMYIC
jgi:hypothetical protein